VPPARCNPSGLPGSARQSCLPRKRPWTTANRSQGALHADHFAAEVQQRRLNDNAEPVPFIDVPKRRPMQRIESEPSDIPLTRILSREVDQASEPTPSGMRAPNCNFMQKQ